MKNIHVLVCFKAPEKRFSLGPAPKLLGLSVKGIYFPLISELILDSDLVSDVVSDELFFVKVTWGTTYISSIVELYQSFLIRMMEMCS